jgi:hypothetical protein
MKRYVIYIIFIGMAFGFSKASAPIAASASDTVIVVPENPTISDSLIFNYHGIDHCCCAGFYDKKVTVTDSTISLYTSVDDEPCKVCRCFAAGFNTTFSCQPIKAGKYKIFYSEYMYCPPGKMCAAIAFVVRSKQVGEVVVRSSPQTTGQISEPKKSRQKLPRQILSYSSAEKKLIIRITKPQFVTVTAYIVSGEKTTQLSSKRFLPAGSHSFNMNQERFASGVAVIHVKGENFSEVKMINFSKE